MAGGSMNYLEKQQAMLVNALALAITAPSDSKAQQATQIALQLTQGLTEKQVDICKKAALALLEFQNETN
jgi:hypothetical protein